MSNKRSRTWYWIRGVQSYLAFVLLIDAFMTDSKIYAMALLVVSAFFGRGGLSGFREAQRLDKQDRSTWAQ